MTTKNNLSAFKRPPARSVLTQTTEAPSVSVKKAVGKPPKPAQERLSKRAQVLFTEEEYAALTEKRGGVPLSSYLRMRLKEAGEI